MACRRFVQDGIAQRRRPEVLGGGLIYILGGRTEVEALSSRGDQILAGPRILGADPFVERLVAYGEGRLRRMHAIAERSKQTENAFGGVYIGGDRSW